MHSYWGIAYVRDMNSERETYEPVVVEVRNYSVSPHSEESEEYLEVVNRKNEYGRHTARNIGKFEGKRLVAFFDPGESWHMVCIDLLLRSEWKQIPVHRMPPKEIFEKYYIADNDLKERFIRTHTMVMSFGKIVVPPKGPAIRKSRLQVRDCGDDGAVAVTFTATLDLESALSHTGDYVKDALSYKFLHHLDNFLADSEMFSEEIHD